MHAVEVGKEKSLVPAVVNLGDHNRSAQRKTDIVLDLFCSVGEIFSTSVQNGIPHVIIAAPMQRRSARLGRVFDKAPARAAVLGRVGALDDLHFLDGVVGRGAFLRLVMIYGGAKRCAVNPVFVGHHLAAVNAGVEPAAAKHRITVRLRRNIARLHLQ